MMTKLTQAGYFRSPLGGAKAPIEINKNNALFEIITAGEVYGLNEHEETLYGVGSVFYHREGEHTIYRSPPDSFYHCLTLRYENPDKNPWPLVFLWENQQSVTQFANEVLQSYHYNNLDKSIIGNYAMNQLKFRLEIAKVMQKNIALPPKLNQALSYIEKFYGQDIQINELSNELLLSSSHMHALFIKYLKKTPHQVIIERRMREACHRLVITMDPIKVVAVEVGYANVENFCRAFKRKHGLTAANYRKKFTVTSF
jgi:AraC-like DNA-binding protein